VDKTVKELKPVVDILALFPCSSNPGTRDLAVAEHNLPDWRERGPT